MLIKFFVGLDKVIRTLGPYAFILCLILASFSGVGIILAYVLDAAATVSFLRANEKFFNFIYIVIAIVCSYVWYPGAVRNINRIYEKTVKLLKPRS